MNKSYNKIIDILIEAGLKQHIKRGTQKSAQGRYKRASSQKRGGLPDADTGPLAGAKGTKDYREAFRKNPPADLLKSMETGKEALRQQIANRSRTLGLPTPAGPGERGWRVTNPRRG